MTDRAKDIILLAVIIAACALISWTLSLPNGPARGYGTNPPDPMYPNK